MSASKRVLKKVSTPFDRLEPSGAILMINMLDPQISTMRVFLEAVEDAQLPFFLVANKMDVVEKTQLSATRDKLGLDLVPASMVTGEGMETIKSRLRDAFSPGDRVAILGVFNSGKTSLISQLTGLDLAIGNCRVLLQSSLNTAMRVTRSSIP